MRKIKESAVRKSKFGRCEQCNKYIIFLPFDCNYCGKHLCRKHRLPENHDCNGLAQPPPDF